MAEAKTANKTPATKVNKAPKKDVSIMPRLKRQYLEVYVKDLMKELELKNVNQVPVLEKVVLNVGLGRSKDDKQMFEVAENTLRKITGQKPVETYAKVSIATFKLREGNKIGLKVTLRGDRMYEFLDRLINIVLPRLRDFHGVKLGAFDKQGNFAIGLSEQSIFPELSFEETTKPHGMQVIIVTKCDNKEDAKALLEKFGMPFEKPQGSPSEKGTK
jgi:large subunit ribosomal protein L5